MNDPVLAIGPANYAGQAHAWALAVDRTLPARAWSFGTLPLRGRPAFSFPVDRRIGRYSFRAPVARGLRSRWLFRRTTHVALDGFQPFFHLRRAGKLPGDIDWLLSHRRAVALIAHGTDVRDPAAHQQRDRWSYFNEGRPEWRSGLTASTLVNRRIADDAGVPVFYSTPDLGFDLPQGTWLPVCLDVDAWASDEPLLERAKPRVLHVPSRRHPPIKGTQYIDPVLRELADEGAIDYVAPTAVSNAEMRQLVRSCDVVVDQLLFGSYGVAAVEAMAAGRVVVGRMIDAVRDRMPEAPDMLEATPETLREVISSVRDRRDELRDRAASNVAFVRRWHDGTESANRLAPFLGVAP